VTVARADSLSEKTPREADKWLNDIRLSDRLHLQVAERTSAKRGQVHEPMDIEWPMIAKPFRQPELASGLQSLLEGRENASQ